MKKILLIPVLIMIAIFSAGCSGQASSSSENTIVPIKLSEADQSLLDSFESEDTIYAYRFRAPEEATSMQINVHRFTQDKGWENIARDTLDKYKAQEATTPSEAKNEEYPKNLDGAFALQIKRHHALEFVTKIFGRRNTTLADIFDPGGEATCTGFHTGAIVLTAPREIELGKEIPVAYMSGVVNAEFIELAMPAEEDMLAMLHTENHEEYFIQMVTLTFSDQEI